MIAIEHVLERTVLIRAKRETVFRYFTDSERFAAWWGGLDGEGRGRRAAWPGHERVRARAGWSHQARGRVLGVNSGSRG